MYSQHEKSKQTRDNTRLMGKSFNEVTRGQSKGEVPKKVSDPPPRRPPGFRYTSTTPSVTEKVETLEEKKTRLKKLSNTFESPFKWRPREVKPLTSPFVIIERIKEKDKEVKEGKAFKWRSFIFHLIISFESWRGKEINQAFVEICSLESVILQEYNNEDPLFRRIKDALYHVIWASKAFLFLELDMIAQAETLLGVLLPPKTMYPSNQAGIHGIKAALFMEYGHRGNKYALENALEAVKLDPKAAEWHFFIGKCMGRLRRVAFGLEPVHPEEVRAMNTALKIDKNNATYCAYVGQVLAERAFRDYRLHKVWPAPDLAKLSKQEWNNIMRTNYSARIKFMKAAELDPNSPHVLIRCAKGIMRLPIKLHDIKVTKEWIDKALKLAPNNPMVHHVQAMYHERYDCDVELQLKAYKKADELNNFSASMDLVRFRHKLKMGNVLEELEKLASRYEQTEKQQLVYAQAGSYLLFIKKDFIGALKYYLKVLQINKTSYTLKSHKPMFIRLRHPVNMLEVLRKELATRTDWNSFPSEDRQLLKAFRIQLMDYEMVENYKGMTTVEEILDMSTKLIAGEDLYSAPVTRWRKRTLRKALTELWYGTVGKVKKSKKSKKEKKVKKETTNVKLNQTSKKRNTKDVQKNPDTLKEDSRCDSASSMYSVDSYYYRDGPEEKNPSRRDSVSSMCSVDSNYYRDSTHYGPRDLFLSNSRERLNSEHSRLYKQNYSTDMANPGSSYGLNSRASSNLSLSSGSSLSSASSYGFIGDSYSCLNPTNDTKESHIPVTNEKKMFHENSVETCTQRLSFMSLSNDSLGSQNGSTKTLSVLDRIRQSYAMIGRTSNPSTVVKKKNRFEKHGSTQSLNIQDGGRKNYPKNKNTGLNGSSQSLNKVDTLDYQVLDNLKSRFTSGESGQSLTFMPAFAQKNPDSH